MGEGTTAWLSAFGFPRAKVSLDFTKAEQEIYDILATKHTPSTPEQQAGWEEKRRAFEAGELSPTEARTYIQKAKTSWLEYHFKHDLEYRQAVEVYDLGTESEKDLLKPLLNQKRYNLLKRGRVSEVEEEQPQ